MPQLDKHVTVDGREYRIATYPARAGSRMFFRVMKTVAPTLASLAQAGKFDRAAFMKALPEAMARVAQDLDPEADTKLLEDLCEVAYFDGVQVWNPSEQKGILDAHFQGRLAAWLSLVTEVCKHNFNDFFSVLASAGRSQLAAMKSTSASPSTSTGSSGDLSSPERSASGM